MTLAEAARRLGLSIKTLQAQARAGRIKATKFGRMWTIEEAEVERYRHEQQRFGR